MNIATRWRFWPRSRREKQTPKKTRWWNDWRYTIGILAAPLFLFPEHVPNVIGIDSKQYVQAVTFIAGAFLLLPFGILVENVTDFFENIFRRNTSSKYDDNAPSLFAVLIHASLTNISFLSLTVFTLLNSVNQGSTAQIKAVEIIQLAIAGGLIVNLLFNLGFAIFVGGLGGKIFGHHNGRGKHEFHSGRLRFSKELANQDVEMITIAVIILALPSLASSLSVISGFFGESTRKLVTSDIPLISIVTSVLLLIIYGSYIGWTVLKLGGKSGSTIESMIEIGRAHV